MFEQLKRLAKSIEEYADRRGYHREWAWRRSVLNNNDWWSKLTVKEYMRMLGKNMRIGPMLGRDSVKNRMTNGDGMSYAEFSYPLIQGWDWWHMFQSGTQIQIGGADQFGNILAGAEAVKTIMQEDVPFMERHRTNLKGSTSTGDPMGFTVPLLTTSAGEKFGKSAGNAIWIDQQLTSSFDLYQFFLRSADADVEKYLKLFTFLPIQEIQQIMKKHGEDESQRTAQHTLAYEFVELVHGKQAADSARAQHTAAFSKTMSIQDLRSQVNTQTEALPFGSRSLDINPSINKYAQPLTRESSFELNIKLPSSLVMGQPLSRVIWSAGLTNSKSEGQRLINSGGVYIGGVMGGEEGTRATDSIAYVPAKDASWNNYKHLIVDGNILCLRTGKWKKKFITIIPDEEFKSLGLTCPGWEVDAKDPEERADRIGEQKYRRLGEEERLEKLQRESSRNSARSTGFGTVTGARLPQNAAARR